MKGEVQLNRRFFFRQSVARILDSVCTACCNEESHSSINEVENKISSLWSDFTPEMIKFEAERLGIDPEDRGTLFSRIQQEMLDVKS